MKILKFGAEWCTSCKTLDKLLEEIENKPYIEVIDIDVNSSDAIKYGIRGVPTLIKIDENNNIVDRIVGTKPKAELEKWLND